jgi:hypothetical protein
MKLSEQRKYLHYNWRGKLLEGGLTALAGKEERSGEKELGREIRELIEERLQRLGVAPRVCTTRSHRSRGRRRSSGSGDGADR